MSRKVTVIEHGRLYIRCPECDSEHYVMTGLDCSCDHCGCVFRPEPDKPPEQTFFEQVKGKKIRWTHESWKPGHWFIPVRLTGDRMEGNKQDGAHDWFIVAEGFNKSELRGEHWELYHEPEPEPLKMAKLLGVKFVCVGEPLPDFEPVQCVKPRASITLRNAADWTDDEAREIANWMRRTGMKMLKERKEYDKRFKATFP